MPRLAVHGIELREDRLQKRGIQEVIDDHVREWIGGAITLRMETREVFEPAVWEEMRVDSAGEVALVAKSPQLIPRRSQPLLRFAER
jgi:hypothetical protein